FGYKRFQVLAPLFNPLTLFLIPIIIIIQPIQTFFNPLQLQSTQMFIISLTPLILNIILPLLMFTAPHTSHNINIPAPFLHLIAHLLPSLPPIIPPILISTLNLTIPHPIPTIILSLLIIKTTSSITNSSLN
ncbi:cation transporter, partial [Staphylococcus saprophyticus]|uniref:cation transporter n=1 Tax=Staphylococcus saprophyticus TaxID=29385 RepID=UPI001642F5E6